MDIFRSKKTQQENGPYDFAQILGSSTWGGKESGNRWDNVNIADGSNKAAQELAAYFIEFHNQLLDRNGMHGLLEPSASLANHRALRLARDYTRKNKVLCTNLSHYSVIDACLSLMLEPIVLDVNPKNDYQVDDDLVAKTISKIGHDIAAVVSTYGTTQLGHIENLAGQSSVKDLRNNGTWVHIDASYGGYIGGLLGNKNKFQDADSITIDPYKIMGKPGIALLLFEEGKAPKQLQIPYYKHSKYTMYTTLSAGPAAAWSKTVDDCGGCSGLFEIISEYVRIARQCGIELTNNSIQLVKHPQMSIVPILLESSQESISIREQLRSLKPRGFNVGNINFSAKDYEIHGIRIVITPKVNPDLMYQSTHKLTKEIVKIIC